jgi:hypothetical protein
LISDDSDCGGGRARGYNPLYAGFCKIGSLCVRMRHKITITASWEAGMKKRTLEVKVIEVIMFRKDHGRLFER